MPLADMPGIGQEADLNQVKDYLMGFRRWLNDFLNHMDTLNIEELDANVILANTITANKLSVSQLSAIAADLGTIVAGIVYGAYIATSQTFPKVELSSSTYLQASNDANHFILITPYSGGTPAIQLYDGVNSKTLTFNINNAGTTCVIGSSGPLQISATGGDLSLSGNNVMINSVNFNTKADKSSVSKTVYVAGTSGAAATTPMTITNGVVTA